MFFKALSASLLALGVGAATVGIDDDFKREGDRTFKDTLEGKAPPALDATGWMNSGGRALDLAALRGNVVLIDFWGTW